MLTQDQSLLDALTVVIKLLEELEMARETNASKGVLGICRQPVVSVY
jgi:hypothetical protein